MQKGVHNDWVKEPKYPNWGFEYPSPHLIKVAVDLRSPLAAEPFPRPEPPLSLSSTSGNMMLPTGSQVKPPPVGDRWPPPLLVS